MTETDTEYGQPADDDLHATAARPGDPGTAEHESPYPSEPVHRSMNDCHHPMHAHSGQAQPLDVERLAVALDNVDQTYQRGWTPAHYARAIAAEYARLLSTPPRTHAAWCWLPLDHQGLCEGDT